MPVCDDEQLTGSCELPVRSFDADVLCVEADPLPRRRPLRVANDIGD